MQRICSSSSPKRREPQHICSRTGGRRGDAADRERQARGLAAAAMEVEIAELELGHVASSGAITWGTRPPNRKRARVLFRSCRLSKRSQPWLRLPFAPEGDTQKLGDCIWAATMQQFKRIQK